MRKLWLAWLALLAFPAFAQQVLPPDGRPAGVACAYNASLPTLQTGQVGWIQCDANGKLIISNPGGGGGSSTGGGGGVANFVPNGNLAALTANATSSQITAPAGASVLLVNTGTTPAYINLGTSSAVTATTSNIPIAPFSPYVLEMGTNTNIAAINPTGTSNITLIGGSDLYQVMLSPLPTQAPTVNVGAVGISQTTPGTTNHVDTGVAQGSTTSGQNNNLMAGAVLTASPTYTTGQTSPLVLDTNGNLRVNVVTGAATGVAQGSTTSGQTGGLTQGAVTTTAPTYTTTQTSPLSLTTAGALRQDLSSVAGTSAALLMVAPSTAPVTATNPAWTVDLRPDSPGIITLGPAAVAGAVPHVLSSQYPVNAVTTTPQPVTATATGTTAATAATIPAISGKTAYICGFTITADATALAVGTAVVSGTISGSLSYLQGISAVTSGAGNLTQNFNPCVPASASNTAIVVTSAAAGTGGNTIVNAQGYYL